MLSPFPGVDPYLETSGGWLGFHQRFVTYASDFLNERLPDSYAAMIEGRVLLLHNHIEVMEGYIEIRRFPEREVVCSIELLSPSIKIDPGREQYLAKRGAILHRGIHLVEIDLLVGGHRLETVEQLPRGDYYAFVSRADHRPKCDVYAWSLRHPLPGIPIPLKHPDTDVVLDMAQVFAQTYDRGLYHRSLRYDLPLALPLSPENLTWAAEKAHSRV